MGEISRSPLARLPGLKSVMSRKKISTCLLFVKLRFQCSDLLLMALGKLMDRRIKLPWVGCEFSLHLELDLLLPDGSA